MISNVSGVAPKTVSSIDFQVYVTNANDLSNCCYQEMRK